MKLFFLTIVLLNIIKYPSSGQKITVSGYVKDASSGESLIGSSILDTNSLHGTSTNSHGFYSITLTQDTVMLLISYVGYKRKSLHLFAKRDTIINISLDNIILDEIVIQDTQTDDIHETTRMSTFTVPVSQINSLPTFFGETDILKALQLTPGVQSGAEGSTGLYVRGGGADQNLILLDGVPIYNASHLFGFFSVFNTDAINHVELTKGGFPARYGGRLSSVINISMKNGNMKELQGEGSIGLIASKITFEGPILKDKTSFIVSGRRTYIDLLAQPIIRKQADGGNRGYFFYDLNFKLNHIINGYNRLYFSTYLGDDRGYTRDKISFLDNDTKVESTNEFGLEWGNIINAFRWNHVFGPKLFSNIAATYSRYNFKVNREFVEKSTSPGTPEETLIFGNQYKSGISDLAAKFDFDYMPDPGHFIKFGFNSIFHKFSPGVYAYQSNVAGDTTAGAATTKTYEFALYIEDDWKISNVIKLNAGIHYSGFLVENHWYRSAQPRVSARFLLRDDLSLKASFSSMTQYIHLLTNVGIGLPTDLWVPSTARIKPQQANQIAAGLAKTYKAEYEISAELYYKKMTNLIEYKDGASYLNIEGNWEDKVAENGKGTSYGMEILMQKKTGKITGWIGYTLSKTTRQFDQLNFTREFPYKYDRRHDVSLAITHAWNENKDFSLVWVYGTGNSITLPIAVYEGLQDSFDSRYDNRSQVLYYGDRNSYRTRSYHRLDISFNFWKKKKRYTRKWSMGIYNVYNRLNPFFIDIAKDSENNTRFIEYSLFPIMPSISYVLKF